MVGLKTLIVGCGYVGRRVADLWLRDGHDVTVLTRSPGRAESFRNAGFTAVVGDVTESQRMPELPECDVMLYAVGFDRHAGVDKRTVYVTGLQQFLERVSGRVARLLYVSSTSVYGQSAGEVVDEFSLTEPTTDSGRICLDAEQAVRDFAAQSRTECCRLRSAGIYGPDRLLRRRLDLRARTPIGGRPDAWLNLIHVDDAALAVQTAAGIAQLPDIVLVSDGTPVTRQTYFETLSRIVDAPPPVFDPERPTRSASRGLNKRCDNRRLTQELGVRLRFDSLENGLRDAVDRSGWS